jgi:hypothetical protein
MASLQDIRARLQAQETKSQNTGGMGDNQVYAHWNIPEGTTCSLRFVPDDDSANPFFWVEKAVIKLPFAGIKGGDQKNVLVHVPCMEMWNETCPILSEVRPWFKDKSLEEMGRKYWKKRSYIFSGFVRENPMEDDSTPENPMRRFLMGPELFKLIKGALLDPELDNLPTDFDKGLDFRITKTTKGGYADYGTSTWARRETALTQFEREAVQTHGLYNLREFLPKKPAAAEISVMQEMFEASVDGKPYDPDRWSAYFRPAGMSAPNSGNSSEAFSTPTPAAKPAPAASSVPPWVDEEEQQSAAPAKEAPPASNGSDKAADILAMIRARQAKPA